MPLRYNYHTCTEKRKENNCLWRKKKLEHIIPEFESPNITNYKLNTGMFESLNIKNYILNTVIKKHRKPGRDGGKNTNLVRQNQTNAYGAKSKNGLGIGDAYIQV